VAVHGGGHQPRLGCCRRRRSSGTGQSPATQQQQQYNNNNNWFGGGGGWFGNDRRYDQRQEREAPVDYSRAARAHAEETRGHDPIVVVATPTPIGWPTVSETPFAEKPEISIVRKHRTDPA